MTDTTVASPSPPRPPRLRRGDRLHTIAAGSIAVLAVLGCILVVNLVNDPTAEKSRVAAAAATSTHPPVMSGPSATAAAGTAMTRAVASPPAAAGTQPSPKVISQPPAAATAPASTPQHVFAPIVILNNSREKGLAEAARARLEAAGFTVTRTGNYQSTYNVEIPTVFYDEGQLDAAQTVLDLIPDVKQAKPKNKNFIADDPLILVITKDFSPTAP
ncbi:MULTISPECIES: LytR C-terminal domain-containing protein [unclassified Frankia]|uniref:LytR C-terminal domain-containing protein n=1 Tax=unclassified Frankia TaxID=2632575 RepID=UPI001EF660FE|nr:MULTISPECIES: LytR C-terminal domain-containing protein [unclassified Frankia]